MKFDTIGSLYDSKSNNFHLMRFILASMVVWTHAVALLRSNENWIGHILKIDIGATAVHGFFVVSGFLITQSALHSKSTTEFMIKRLLRIVPAFFVSLTLVAFVIGPLVTPLSMEEYFQPGGADPYSFVWKNLAFGYPADVWRFKEVFSTNPSDSINGSMWTLKFEMAMYLIIALLLLTGLIRKRASLIVLQLLMIAGLIAYYGWGWQPFMERIIYYWVLNYWNYDGIIEEGFFFVCGALMYAYRDKIPLNKKLFIAAIIGMIIAVIFKEDKLGLFLFLPYIVIYCSVNKRYAAFQKYGDYSYGIYIFHFPLMQTILFINKNWTVEQLFVISFFVTLVVAFISWHLIEKPSLGLKKKLGSLGIKNKVQVKSPKLRA